MRKFALIAALVLISAAAQAGESRNLTLAASDEATTAQPPAAQAAPTEAPKAVEATPAETPKYVDRPAPLSTTADAPKADAAKPVVAQGPKPDKPKHKRYWTEARIIGELHRHGVYW